MRIFPDYASLSAALDRPADAPGALTHPAGNTCPTFQQTI